MPREKSDLAVGKGNPEWNYSAPHGAGRIMSRSKAKHALSMDDYKKEMAGVYTTSVNEQASLHKCVGVLFLRKGRLALNALFNRSRLDDAARVPQQL